MLLLSTLPERDHEGADFGADLTLHAEHVPLMAVLPLIERPGEPDPRLNANDDAGPRDLHGDRGDGAAGRRWSITSPHAWRAAFKRSNIARSCS